MSQRRDESWLVILGFLLILGINGAVIFTLILFGATVYVASCFSVSGAELLITPISYVIYSIGIVQLLYVVPLVFILKQKQQWEWMKGIIIGAVLTALLNTVFFFK